MLFLNMAIMLETLIVWVEKLDFSNVFQNDYEMTLRGLSGFEFWQTIPNIWYLFLVYFFLIDIREYYTKQDGTVQVFIFSYYTGIAKSWLDFAITYVNSFMQSTYELQWLSIEWLALPILWTNIAIQWTGKLILDITKWCFDIFIIVFLWFYSILVIIFGWFVPLFRAGAIWIPAPVWF